MGMIAEPGLRFLILILFCSFSIKFINRPLLLVARNGGRILLCSPIIIYKFRIKHSRSEPSVISASEPEVGVGRFAPLGSSVNACRTWAPFLILIFFCFFSIKFLNRPLQFKLNSNRFFYTPSIAADRLPSVFHHLSAGLPMRKSVCSL